MTDKAGGIFDAANQAVRMERIEGDQRLLASQVKQSVDTLTSTLHALQSETRNVSTKLSDLAGLQGAHDFNRSAIDEVKRSVGELNTRLEEWFDDFDDRNNRRWEVHEADNENDKRELEKEIRSVRETIIRGIGFGSAVSVVAGIVVGGFLWNLNYRFNDISSDTLKDTTRIETAATRNRQLIDDVTKDYGKELADIKLYLARGGRIPDEPYVPQSQRKTK